MEMMALNEVRNVTGKLGRLGVGLITEIEAREEERTETALVRGRLIQKLRRVYYCERDMSRLRERNGSSETRPFHKGIDARVSDHFGIAVRIQVF